MYTIHGAHAYKIKNVACADCAGLTCRRAALTRALLRSRVRVRVIPCVICVRGSASAALCTLGGGVNKSA